MKSHDALLHAWDETLARRSAEVAIFSPTGEVSRTFARIEADAERFARKIGRFDAGSVVGIQIGNHPDWPALLLVCLRQQIVVLPLEQSMSDADRGVALKICNASAVVVAAAAGEDFEIEQLTTEAPPAWPGQPPSLLKLTSGTTAAPRAIQFRSEQLLADCNQICDSMGIEERDLNFGVIPVSHSYGFSNLITPLIARGVAMVLSRDRLPRAVLDDIARTKATVFPGMPVFYQAFCEMDQLPRFNDLRLCISAGAPLNVSLAHRFREKFGRTIHSFYGSSECGGICYDRDGSIFDEGYVGTPLRGVHIDLLDPAANASQVRVHSSAVGDGYFPNPDPAKFGGGMFMPDDLLAQSGNGGGGFKIVGRISDLINVAGKKVNPAQIEEQLLRVRGVREAIAFGRRSAQRNEEVAACVVAECGLTEAGLLEFCRARLSAWQVPKRIFVVDAIPVNERGKVNRRDLAQRFAN